LTGSHKQNPIEENVLFYQIQSDEIVRRIEQQRFNFFVGKLEQDEFVVGLDQQNAVGVDAQNNVIS
jgi:hypothetical protein